MVAFWQTEKAEGEKEGREEESNTVKTGDGRVVVLVLYTEARDSALRLMKDLKTKA